MKIKSVAGLTCHVKNLTRTIKFYRSLGFVFRTVETDHAAGYVNWFWIDFVRSKGTSAVGRAPAPSDRMLVCLNVEDIEAFRKSLRTRGIRLSSDLQALPGGGRGCVIHDPDGYALMVFER